MESKMGRLCRRRPLKSRSKVVGAGRIQYSCAGGVRQVSKVIQVAEGVCGGEARGHVLGRCSPRRGRTGAPLGAPDPWTPGGLAELKNVAVEGARSREGSTILH